MLKFVFIYIYFVPASGVDVLSLTYAMCGARTGITQVHVLCLITTNFVAVAVPQLAEVEQILNLHLIWCIYVDHASWARCAKIGAWIGC